MSTSRDSLAGLRRETRLGPHTVVVHYRAPLPGSPGRDEYEQAVTAAAEVYAGTLREQPIAEAAGRENAA